MNSHLSIICRVCKSKNNILAFQAKNYKLRTDILFDYLYCNDCESIFLKDIPNDISKYYDANYNPFQISSELDLKDKENLNIIKSTNKNSSILELGVGNGNLLIKLNELNFKCFCIEPYSEVTSKLKKNKITVFEQLLEEIKISELDFKVDIIYAWHSIEHLKNLDIFFDLCDKVLNKDGIIILSTPNKESFSYKFYKQYWYHIEAPLHSFIINPDELVRRFEKKNYNVKKFIKNFSSIVMSKYGWETSGYYKKKSLGNNYHGYIGKFLSFFMPYVEFLTNKTAQTTLILKK